MLEKKIKAVVLKATFKKFGPNECEIHKDETRELYYAIGVGHCSPVHSKFIFTTQVEVEQISGSNQVVDLMYKKITLGDIISLYDQMDFIIDSVVCGRAELLKLTKDFAQARGIEHPELNKILLDLITTNNPLQTYAGLCK